MRVARLAQIERRPETGLDHLLAVGVGFKVVVADTENIGNPIVA